MQGDARSAGRGIQVPHHGDGSHAGPHPPPRGLQAAVLYPGHDQDHEGEPGETAVHQAPGAEKGDVGRPSVEPLVLRGDRQ